MVTKIVGSEPHSTGTLSQPRVQRQRHPQYVGSSEGPLLNCR